MGVDLVIFSNVVIRRIVGALQDTLLSLREAERIQEVMEEIAPLGTVFELTHADGWLARQSRGPLAAVR
jgi:hypothetical protein